MTSEKIEQNISMMTERIIKTANNMDLSLNKYVYQNRYNKIMTALYNMAKKVAPSNVFDTDVCPYKEKDSGSYHLAQRITFGPSGIGYRDPTQRGSHSYLMDPKQIVNVVLLDPEKARGIMNWLIANNKMKGLKEWNEMMQTVPYLEELNNLIRMGNWEDRKGLTDDIYFTATYGNIEGDRDILPIRTLSVNRKDGGTYDTRLIQFSWARTYDSDEPDISLNAHNRESLVTTVNFLLNENIMESFNKEMEKLETHNSILITPQERDKLKELFEKVETQLAVELLSSSI